MRVEATSASYLYTASLRTVDRAREITATAAQAANAPQAVEDAPCDESSKPVDFTCMTLKEMYRWLHEQYLQGEMTADESFIFGIAISLACTTRIYESGEIAVLQDVKMNFMEIAREHVEFVREYDYGGAYGGLYKQSLEAGWAAMQRAQGVSRSVDTFA